MKKGKRTKIYLTLILFLLPFIFSNLGSGISALTVAEESGIMDQIIQNKEANPFGWGSNWTAEEMVQKICLAVNEPDERIRIYHQLPKWTKDQLSEDVFLRYMKALEPVNKEKIFRFSELAPEYVKGYINQMNELKPELLLIARSTRFFSLDYSISSGKRQSEQDVRRIILGVQENEEGLAQLSVEWIQPILFLSDYSKLYFDAITRSYLDIGELDSLTWLLEGGNKAFDGVQWHEYNLKKARLIGKYYADLVSTDPSSSRCLYLLPGIAAYTQQYRYGQSLSGVRSVRFFEKEGKVTVQEPIPDELNKEDDSLMINNEKLFQERAAAPGEKMNYTEKSLNPMVGPVLSIEELPEEQPVNGNEKQSIKSYEINYYGLSLRIKGEADAKKHSWKGEIESIRISSRIFSLGAVIRPGILEANFHLYRPFYLENERMVEGDGKPFHRMSLNYELNGESISAFVLK